MKTKQPKPLKDNQETGIKTSLPANKYADIRKDSEKHVGLARVQTAYDRAQPQDFEKPAEKQESKPNKKKK